MGAMSTTLWACMQMSFKATTHLGMESVSCQGWGSHAVASDSGSFAWGMLRGWLALQPDRDGSHDSLTCMSRERAGPACEGGRDTAAENFRLHLQIVRLWSHVLCPQAAAPPQLLPKVHMALPTAASHSSHIRVLIYPTQYKSLQAQQITATPSRWAFRGTRRQLPAQLPFPQGRP